MAIPLTPARTARLFADLKVQQQTLLAELSAAGPDEEPSVLLPHCPACRRRPYLVRLDRDGTAVRFAGCGHDFALTRQALIAGLRAQRAV